MSNDLFNQDIHTPRAGEIMVASGNVYGKLGRVVIALAALWPLTWYRPGRIVKGIDSFLSLNPVTTLHEAIQSWSTVGSAGVPNSQIPGLPMYVVQAALHEVGIPLSLAALVIISMLALIAGYGVYGLVLLITRLEGMRIAPAALNLGAVSAALAWIMCPVALAQVWYRLTFLDVTWAVLPWLLWVLLRSIIDNSWKPRQAFVGAGATVLLGSAGLPEAYLPGIAILVTSWCVPPLIYRLRSGDGRALSRIGAALGGVILGTIWWVLPALPFLSSIVAETRLSPGAHAELSAFSPYLTVWNILTLRDAPLLWQTVSPNGARFEPWAGFITGGVGFALPYLVPFVALTGIVLARRKRASTNGVILGTGIAILVGVLVTKGLNPPVPGLGTLLLSLPFGSVFRDPASTLVFIAALPICVLFGLGVTLLATLPGRLLAYVVIVYTIVPASLVWWTAEVIPGRVGSIPSTYITVPASYARFGAWANQTPVGGKIMVVPYSKYGQTALRWASGADTGPDCLIPSLAPHSEVLCGNTTIHFADLPGQSLAKAVATSPSSARALAWLWGIDVWLVHRDWAYSVAPATVDGKQGAASLSRLASRMPPGNVFRSHHLLAVRQKALPLVYVAHSAISGGNRVVPLTAKELMTKGTASMVTSGLSKVPDCSSHAVVKATDAANGPHGRLTGSGTVCLVFGETYSHGWRLEVQPSSGKVLHHFVANWWENGWVVRLKAGTRWKMVYAPGQSVQYGLLVGVVEWLALGVGGVICVVIWFMGLWDSPDK